MVSRPFLLLLLFLGALCGPLAFRARGQEETAEQAWQKIEDRVKPKIVAWMAATPEERKKMSFHQDIAAIGAFARQYARTDPDYADAARVFLARQILDEILGQADEALQILQSVVQTASSPMVAGMAALHACEIHLGRGDADAIEAVRELYSRRKEKEQSFVDEMERLLKVVRLQPGRPFPRFGLVDRAGKPQDPADHPGQFTLLVVFVSTTGQSESLLQACVRAAKEHQDRLRVVGISLDEKEEILDQVLKEAGADFPVVWDGLGWKGPLVKRIGISTLPANFLIGPEGLIRFAWFSNAELEELVRTALEPPSDGG